MYTHMSKCRNDKIKKIFKRVNSLTVLHLPISNYPVLPFLFTSMESAPARKGVLLLLINSFYLDLIRGNEV
jgi:hypothetical protein